MQSESTDWITESAGTEDCGGCVQPMHHESLSSKCLDGCDKLHRTWIERRVLRAAPGRATWKSAIGRRGASKGDSAIVTLSVYSLERVAATPLCVRLRNTGTSPRQLCSFRTSISGFNQIIRLLID